MAAVLNRKRSMVSSLNNVYLDDYRNTGTEFMLGFYTFGQERRPQKGETHDPY
jgi:hypothetical protein